MTRRELSDLVTTIGLWGGTEDAHARVLAAFDALTAEVKRERERAERAEDVVAALVRGGGHLDLGDLVYEVREREGRGWDGPAVKAWSDAVVEARQIASNVERRLRAALEPAP